MSASQEARTGSVPYAESSSHAEAHRRRGWLIRRALLSADIIGLVVAFVATALTFGASGQSPGSLSQHGEILLFAVTLPLWPFVAKLYGLYDSDEERTDHSTADDVARIIHVVTVGVWLLASGSWLTSIAEPEIPKLTFFWAMTISLMVAGRFTARVICRRSRIYVQRTLIVGADSVGLMIARKLEAHPEYRIQVVGVADDRNPTEIAPDLDLRILGNLKSLPEIVERERIDRVIISFSAADPAATLDFVRELRKHDVQVDIVPRLYPMITPQIGVHSVEGLPLIGLRPFRLGASSLMVKRIADIAIASAALVLLSPLLIVIALAIKADSEGPVFFRQVRMGRGDQTFRIIKFRTMVKDADKLKAELDHLNIYGQGPEGSPMFKVIDDPRVTRVGRILRRHFIDEIPQLFNVVGGTMSLVGPRPLILTEDSHVLDWARRRLDLRPGMTGLWQVLGRNSISFDEMIALDYTYVTSWTLGGDLRIIARTIPLIIGGAGGRL